MRILLPVDGSDNSQRAVAAFIAQLNSWRDRPEVHLLHVHPPLPVGRAPAHVGHDALQRYYREESEAAMLQARNRLDEAGVDYKIHIHVGQPAEVIARLAGELVCDLVLMGTRGLGAVGALVLGSVASDVVRLASCPVQVVK